MPKLKSNVTPFRTCKDLWVSWMQQEEQEFDDPYLTNLHKKLMRREEERNLKPVDFFYTVEYTCEEERAQNVKAQFTDTMKVLFGEIGRTAKPYGFRDLKGKIEHGFKDGVHSLHIGLECLIFLEDLVSTLLCNADMYGRILGIKVLSIEKVKDWPGV